MNEIFRKLIEDDFSDLAGLTVEASIPVPEHIINEIIEAALRGNKNINSCRVSIARENRVSANLKTPLWLWRLNFKLKLDNSVDLTGSPKVRAWLENNSLLGKLSSIFKALPDGVTIINNQVIVDIGAFLQKVEQKRIAGLIKSVGINTENGKVIFDVKVEV